MRRKTAYGIISGLLFFFVVPVVPAIVSSQNLLPDVNQCHGLFYSPRSLPVFASMSYVTSRFILGLFIHGGGRVEGWGGFGLVYVLNNGGYAVQFPPFGFKPILCF